jgi:arginyl-tRNA synthetase
MKLKKKDLLEIIDTNGELIGSKNIPDVDPNADTQAKNTTDHNAKIGTQPFRYDMLGRFGFTLMPFMEGEEKNDGQKKLLDDLAELMYERYREFLKYFYKHPQQLKQDYRKKTRDGVSFENDEEGGKKIDYEWAEKILKIVEKHFDESLKNLDEQFKENIAESKVHEDKMVNKTEDEISTKVDDGEVREKKLEKIAGLINKLEKKDINKLINLLEKKNG